jgi:hypothetical protein
VWAVLENGRDEELILLPRGWVPVMNELLRKELYVEMGAYLPERADP